MCLPRRGVVRRSWASGYPMIPVHVWYVWPESAREAEGTAEAVLRQDCWSAGMSGVDSWEKSSWSEVESCGGTLP